MCCNVCKYISASQKIMNSLPELTPYAHGNRVRAAQHGTPAVPDHWHIQVRRKWQLTGFVGKPGGPSKPGGGMPLPGTCGTVALPLRAFHSLPRPTAPRPAAAFGRHAVSLRPGTLVLPHLSMSCSKWYHVSQPLPDTIVKQQASQRTPARRRYPWNIPGSA